MDGQDYLGVARLISGGQTGVDRGALDAAIELGLQHGGWCPRGRLAEDGTIPQRYRLVETDSSDYWVRTERNVMDADGTLILYRQRLSGGTEFTYRMTKKHRKPALLIDLLRYPDSQAARDWIMENGITILNVAGPRESTADGVSKQAEDFIQSVFRA